MLLTKKVYNRSREAAMYPTPAQHESDFSMPLAVIVSLLVHAVLFFLMHQSALQPARINQEIIEVSIVPEQALRRLEKQQIVTAPKPEPELQAPPQETNRLSDEDVSVVKEQIKRGSPLSAPSSAAQKPQPAQPQKPAVPNEQQQKPLQKEAPQPQKAGPKKDISLSDLTLDSKSLLSNFSQTSPQRKVAPSKQMLPSNYQAFSRPLGSGAQFMSDAGSADYLPNLPDGDLTLLNAKANQFAVFVRRVAIQVFSQIRSLGWENLSRSDINAISDFTTVIATMSDKGELLKVTLDDSSSSSRFDSIIMSAARAGTKDPNPPAAARASDGTIKFIFKAKSWSEIGAGRSGIPTERRWLLLSTGLE